jgi:hypothetical protein
MSTSQQYLIGLEGQQVTLNPHPQAPVEFPTGHWIIIEKLEERAYPLTQADIDIDIDRRPPCVQGKFLCALSLPGGPPVVAYLRIHKQIPITGTEFQRPDVRATQAVRCDHLTELDALLAVKEHNLRFKGQSITPRLIGYRRDEQDQHDLVPGGYLVYLAWEKVPGVSLDHKTFWDAPFSTPQSIRETFAKIYTSVFRVS